MKYEDLKEKVKILFREVLFDELSENPGISTRTNLYTAEVLLVKAVLHEFTGMNPDSDGFHDFACDLVDKAHAKFDG